MDTVIALRMFERILAVVVGGLSVYFGYRLLKIPITTTASGSIKLPSDITVVLSSVGPGIFFALFGVSVIALSLYQHVQYGEGQVVHGEQSKQTSEPEIGKHFAGAAPAIADTPSDNRHDARVFAAPGHRDLEYASCSAQPVSLTTRPKSRVICDPKNQV